MGRYSRLHRIRQMDPHQDYEEIFRWVTQYEFPWDYLQGVSVAFLRDYGVPRISRLLDRTQEFERAGQKRYDDTVLIAHEMVRDGMESEQARAAARHLNRIHGRYRIPNDDYLYVLATTVVGPKRWIDRYGWRALSEQETESLALVGRRMGELMGITGIPADYAGFAHLHDTYEQRMFAYDPANRRVAAATLRVVTQWYPNLLRPLVARVSLAVLDEPLLTALGFRPQPRRSAVPPTTPCAPGQHCCVTCRRGPTGGRTGTSPAATPSAGPWTTSARTGPIAGRCGLSWTKVPRTRTRHPYPGRPWTGSRPANGRRTSHPRPSLPLRRTNRTNHRSPSLPPPVRRTGRHLRSSDDRDGPRSRVAPGDLHRPRPGDGQGTRRPPGRRTGGSGPRRAAGPVGRGPLGGTARGPAP